MLILNANNLSILFHPSLEIAPNRSYRKFISFERKRERKKKKKKSKLTSDRSFSIEDRELEMDDASLKFIRVHVHWVSRSWK